MIAPILIKECFRNLSHNLSECTHSMLMTLIRAEADDSNFPGTGEVGKLGADCAWGVERPVRDQVYET